MFIQSKSNVKTLAKLLLQRLSLSQLEERGKKSKKMWEFLLKIVQLPWTKYKEIIYLRGEFFSKINSYFYKKKFWRLLSASLFLPTLDPHFSLKKRLTFNKGKKPYYKELCCILSLTLGQQYEECEVWLYRTKPSLDNIFNPELVSEVLTGSQETFNTI